MPSIATQTKRFQEAVESGALQPTATEPQKPPIPVADYPVAVNSYSRGPLPATSVQQPDMQRGWQTGATPQVRLIPTTAISSPIAGAAAASQSIQVVQSSQGALFETNNIPNAKQSILNLIQGANIQLSSDTQGGVTITGTAGGDGLVHGDAVWEYDSAYVNWRDDFAYGSTSAGLIGELGWNTGAVGAGSQTPSYSNTVGGLPGASLYQIEVTNVTNETAFISNSPQSPPNTDWRNTGLPLLDYPGWKCSWVFTWKRPDYSTGTAFDMSKQSTYIGLGQHWVSSFGTRPPIFFGARYDTDTTVPSINDTTIHLEACINGVATSTSTRLNNQGTNGGTFDTGITPVENTMYRLEISCAAAGQVKITLNGVGSTFTVTPFTCTIDTAAGISEVNGLVTLAGRSSLVNTSTGNFMFGPGSKVTFSGLTVNTAYNTTLPCLQIKGTGNGIIIASLGGSTPSFSVSYNAAGYPTLIPFAMEGNDSNGSPAALHSRCLAVDFFDLVWNKGLAGATNPSNTLARYW